MPTKNKSFQQKQIIQTKNMQINKKNIDVM